ncbi:MAG TPA: SDR family oxidoreductase [Xanthobacteraceae bacterium]|nr:SDR family oxidoreductase [Xanthobacteraceae bacterium]
MTAANPVLLITGASRGIGAAIAGLAARRGYDVAVNYLKDRKSAEAVVADVAAAGRRAVAVQADMGREDDIVRMFATVDHELGRLTHLVYNTGIIGPASRIEALATRDAREILDVNVLGAFIAARAAIARLSTRHGGGGGSMVFLSSAMATLGGAGDYVMYSASKAAIDTLTLGLARELATEGIRVNAVAPGPVATDIHPPGRLERLAPAVPLGRAGTAEEIAEAVVFLLSDASSFTTGVVLRVAGGR